MQKLLLFGIAITLVLGFSMGRPADAQAAPAARITARATATVTSGQTLTISGTVAPRAGGKAIEIQTKLGGKWVFLARVTVRSNGYFVYQFRAGAAAKREFRIKVPSSKTFRTTYSRSFFSQIAAAPSSVTITSVGATALSLGEHYHIMGKTSANVAGKPIRVIIKQPSGWVALVTGQIRANATFDLWAKTTQAGRGKVLAVYVPATSTTRASMSGTRTFDVYQWYDLSALSAIKTTGDVAWTKNANWTTVNGEKYARSVSGYLNAWGDSSQPDVNGTLTYNTNKSCTMFEATVGWDDQSWQATGDFTMYGDNGELAVVNNISAQSSTTVMLGLIGQNRLSLGVTLRAQDASFASGFFVMGNARIRCAF